MCGTLLHGNPKLVASACTNRRFGAPIDRDGNKLIGPDGCPQTGKQPPCLLRHRAFPLRLSVSHTPRAAWSRAKQRFSPSLFAREAPEMFQHDEKTNRLRLAEGMTQPWLRHDCPDGTTDTWAFCAGVWDASQRSSQLVRRPAS